MGTFDALLRRHRPQLRYDSHEIYFADAAEIWTDNATNELRRGDEVLASAEPPAGTPRLSLALLGPIYGGDPQQPARSDDFIANTSRDYDQQARLLHELPRYRNRMYGRAKLAGEGLWLQYWFFYFYNSYNLAGYGLHEGDWEMIQLRLVPKDGPDRVPDLAVYAQHRHAEQRDFEDVEKVAGDPQRPVVYVARGSHASYFTPGRHWAGTGFDHANGKRPAPELELEIVDVATPSWVAWPGRWGGTGDDPEDPAQQPSPTAPCMHEQWGAPAALLERPRPAEPGEQPAPPPAPAITLARADNGVLRVDYAFPPPSPARGTPQRLLVTTNSPEVRSPPASFWVDITESGHTAYIDAKLHDDRSYDVYVSATTDRGLASESIGLSLDARGGATGETAGAGWDPVSKDPVAVLRQLLGSVAGIAVLTYLTGAVVLVLRLSFHDLPALGVVGQLPRNVVLSIGASQIVIPALVAAVFHLAWRGTVATRKADELPRPWWIMRRRRIARARHLLFIAVCPTLLVVPGALLAVGRLEGAGWGAGLAAVAFVITATGLYRWHRWQHAPGRSSQTLVPESWNVRRPWLGHLRLREVLSAFSGGLLWLAVGGALAFVADRPAYMLLVVAWFAALPITLAYVFLRAMLGERLRRDPESLTGSILMSLLVALVVVPGLIAFWSAWRLEEARACILKADDAATTAADGLLVGETSDRIYIGVSSEQDAQTPSRMVSIRADRLERLRFGPGAQDVSC